MDDLKQYVERLFKGRRETREIRELKDEILSNLEAKVADYTAEGMLREEAVSLATRSIESVDLLITGNQPVYRQRFNAELAQACLLYLLVAWVLTIPLRLMFAGVMINNLFTLAVIICGVIYLAIALNRDETDRSSVSVINLSTLVQLRKVGWLVWGLSITIMAAWNTVKHFGSDFWFGRPVQIDGPHQFTVIAAGYLIPLVTIVLPLLLGKAVKLAEKHEVKR